MDEPTFTGGHIITVGIVALIISGIFSAIDGVPGGFDGFQQWCAILFFAVGAIAFLAFIIRLVAKS